jgi:hypothetical protein
VAAGADGGLVRDGGWSQREELVATVEPERLTGWAALRERLRRFWQEPLATGVRSLRHRAWHSPQGALVVASCGGQVEGLLPCGGQAADRSCRDDV